MMSVSRIFHSKLNLKLLAGAALLACAGGAHALSFQDAYDAALRNDPTYRVAFYENESGKENRVLGRSALLPSVSANSSVNRNLLDRTIRQPNGRETTDNPRYLSKSHSISLRQPLINMDGLARYKQGKAQSEMSEAIFDVRTGEVAIRVAGAYFDALLARDQLRLAKAQRDMYAEQSTVNRRMFQAGQGTRTDMLETQARLDVAQAAVLEAEDQVTIMRNTLEEIVGTEVGNLDELNADFRFLPLSPATYEDWKAIALQNNADVKAGKLATEVSRQEINKARAGHLPRLDLVASYSKADSETINTLNQDTNNKAIGVQLTVPLYSGGAVSAQGRQAVAGFERAKADLEVRTDKVLVELRKAHSQVVSSVTRIEALNNAVSSGHALLNATTQSIKGGERINLDLLTAQQQLTTSQRDLAQARYTYLLATLRLRNAAGVLSRSDIEQVAGFFRKQQ
ncbi:hypothetical protein GCM10007387_41830 [Pseudoduganella albidiflava]|uniref:TolC family outer membrane protein n=2 Tax=Pseudoduganella albidiflava TaxID=321983 RepID=A0AA87Y067_9BURK|nr:hypothetical protein GCM10007387_41830 [Pseudoduganella albidiflava]